MAIRLIIRRRDAGEGAAPAAQTFEGPIVTIGSDPGASLHLDDRAIAAEQAIIIGGDGDETPLFINRADGTALNGEQLAREARRPLSDGDSISIGPYVISLQTGNGFRPGAAPGLVSNTADAPDANAGRDAPITRETPAFTDGAAPPTPPPPQHPTSFAAILDSLRTEEDTFYFQVETATAGRRRVPVEGVGMLLGWDWTGQNVACGDAGAVMTARATVHKDWSGVVLQPEEAGAVAVNGEPVEAARRLRNGDRVTLRPTAAGSAGVDTARNFFIFYEPASLVVLDSLLPPQQLPPPVAPPPSGQGEAASAALVPADSAPPAVRAPARPTPAAHRYFGYFTLGEVALMACATLAAAFVIFLILEYS
jgi:pSer/pThr/pTyr-binding forkhead associated (FHA) protein